MVWTGPNILPSKSSEHTSEEKVKITSMRKSALLERDDFGDKPTAALALIDEGIALYPAFAKLYMMGGQICSDTAYAGNQVARARKFYERGLQQCPNNAVLWTLTSRLEERASGATKARSVLELARLRNPKTPQLWLEAIRLERRAGNPKMAETLMAKALQECPTAGGLLAENIRTAPRVEQKSKSALAIQRCSDDPTVITAVACLFASERKNEKARKWFDRAAILQPNLGDTWARFYAFELEAGTKEQQSKVKERCIAAEPKYGDLWTSVMKDPSNRGKSSAEGLDMVAQNVLAATAAQKYAS
jgi:pre-mRNA-processing factor 6